MTKRLESLNASSMKISVYKHIEEGIGDCSWCGRLKIGFYGDTLEASVACLKDNKKLEWLSAGFFSTPDLYWVIDPDWEIKKATVRPLICKDCIRSLSKSK